MPVYLFEIAPFLAGRSVTVRDASGSDVASGTLDANARFTASLPVGDYVASASDGRYTYRASGVVDQGDPDRLADSALSSTYGPDAAGMKAAFASSAQVIHNARKFDIRRAKGGVIGTNGKGVVAWRVDHLIDQHRATTWPILRDRGMPCGLGIVTKALPPNALDIEPTTTTWDQLRTMHWEGCEIWAHSATHKEPAPLGKGGGLTLQEEIVGPRDELEAQNLRVMGWQMPGINPAPTLTPAYSDNFDSADKFNSEVGQFLLSTYGLIEAGLNASVSGAVRTLPTEGIYTYAHTVTVESAPLATCKTYVDLAVDYGVGIELMFHPKYIGMAGYMSVADFTALADYVKSKWDAGSIEVLTPSGLCFADPSTSRRYNWIKGGDFEGLTISGSTAGSWLFTNTTDITINTDGGHSGSNYLRLGATSTGLARQANTFVKQLGMAGTSQIVEAWVRAPSADATVGVDLVDNAGTTPTFRTIKTFALTGGSGWQKIRLPFCIPKTCPNIMVRFNRWTGGAVDVDDVSVRVI